MNTLGTITLKMIQLEELRRELENDYLKFVSYAFLRTENKKFDINYHHEVMAEKMTDVFLHQIKNIIINIAPRFSKTVMCVIYFVAWCYAKNKKCNFIHLSYSDSLVLKNSSQIRDIITSDWYQELWPIKIKRDSNAKNNWVIEDGGTFYAAPTAGQITGFGAGAADPTQNTQSYDWMEKYKDLFEVAELEDGYNEDEFQGCFTGENRVTTKEGLKRIDEVKLNELVLSYNHDTKKTEWKKIQAIRIKNGKDFTTVKTSNKTKITATSDHRFFDGDSYREISSFIKRDNLFMEFHKMHRVRKDRFERKDRASKINETKPKSNILLNGLRSKLQEKTWIFENVAKYNLSHLQNIVSSSLASNKILLNGLQELRSFKTNEGGRKFELSGSSQLNVEADTVSQDKNIDNRKGQLLCYLQRKKKEFFGSSPCGRKQIKQCSRESSYSLSKLSCHTPQVKGIPISEIKRDRKREDVVYDIQVEGNHNFFIEGILAHNCIIIDDPQKSSEALSKTIMNKINERLNNTILSRRNSPKKTPIVIVMQRLSTLDMTGFCLDGGTGEDFEHLCMPAITEDGESMWPEKFTIDQLLKMQVANSHTFVGQYMQAPVALGGNVIKPALFKSYRELPFLRKRFITGDTATKDKEINDYTVFQCWGIGHDNFLYLIDQWRGKPKYNELKTRFKAFWSKHKDGYDHAQYGHLSAAYIEDASSGVQLIQEAQAEGRIPVIPITRKRGKVERVYDILLPKMESGFIHIPDDATWLNDFFIELEDFTYEMTHKHDDQIDPLVDAVEIYSGDIFISNGDIVKSQVDSKTRKRIKRRRR